MANKKITVLGDTADESLTPEEEHKIEVKIDKMLAPDVPEEKPVEVPEQPTDEMPKIQKRTSKILVIDAPDEAEAAVPEAPSAEAIILTPQTASAPPLPKKSAKKLKIAITEHADEIRGAEPGNEPETDEPAEEKPDSKTPAAVPDVAEPEGLSVDELPKDSLNIDIPVAEAELTKEEPTEDMSTEDAEVLVADDASEKGEAVPAALDEPANGAETKPKKIQVADEKPSSNADEPSVKKYRPPDGPLPFKRAEPAAESGTSEIVDDITKDASSKLSDEDEAIAQAFNAKPAKRRPHIGGLPRAGLLAKILVVIVILIVGLSIAVPQVRAVALNLAHMHSTLKLSVVDGKTHQPLSGVTAQIGTVAVTTDQNGEATFNNLKLGSQTVSFQKSAFAPLAKEVFLSWKTASLKDVSLQETGTAYSFVVVDYVSGQPLSGAQASGGSSTARSDAKGHIDLLLDAPKVQSKPVMFTANGYRSATAPLPTDPSKKVTVELVPSGQPVYISKQAGRYNLYKTSVNGQDPRLLLAATGNESSQMDVVTNDAGDQVALVSTRDNLRDKAGYLLDTLSLVNVADGKSTTLDHGQQIDIVGWFGTRIVYTVLKPDVSATDPARYQLIGYDTHSKKRSTLAEANAFNDIATVKGVIYYAAANHYNGGSSQLNKISPDGSAKQTLLSTEVTAILRTGYDDLLFMTPSSYYAYKPGGTKPTVTNSTYSGKGRLYVDSPDSKHSVWVDTEHDKLMLYDKATSTEKTLATDANLAYPVRWLNDSTLVYRLSNTNIAGDYAISTSGGAAKKIATVVDTKGLKLWRD